MGGLAFGNLLGVATIAFLAPLALALAPRVPVPAVVLELLAGILVGPQVLGLLDVDDPVAVLSLLGLATLLFLAGLEVDPHALRGPLLRLAATAFAASLALAVLVGLVLRAAGVVEDALFVAIVLSATSLGVVVPVLKDAGLVQRPLGQLVVVGASLADVVTIVLLSLLFSTESASATAQALLLGGLAVLAATTVAAVRVAGRSVRLGDAIARLAGTTAEIRVRGAVLLLVAFVALAQATGLEVILGAFIAGLVLGTVDPDGAMRRPEFRGKLQAVGFGLLVPVFFVASGLRYDVDALVQDAGALLEVPLFLAALLLVRGLPALLLRGRLEPGQWRIAGLLSATTLPFVVAATQIGLELGLLAPATAAALVAAGLLSVLLFPATALVLLRRHVAVQRRTPFADDQGMTTAEPVDLDFSELRVMALNCTLKRSPEPSNTAALMENALAIMEAHGVHVDRARPVDHVIAPGVQPDMTEHGAERDDWPGLQARVLAADILLLGSPIWLGARSSVCTRVVERLYASSGELNEQGQWTYYGRVGGLVVTGNEDGIKHVAMETLYSLQHLGYVIPPQADCGWIGEAGPGPSYADAGSGGRENDFTRRNTAFMAWNLMHVARMLKRAGGMPAHGNQRAAWDAGARFDHPNPEYR